MEFTCTLDDYREANACHAHVSAASMSKNPWSTLHQAVFLMLFLVCVVVLCNRPLPLMVAGQTTVQIDVFLIFLPALAALLWWIARFGSVLYRKSGRSMLPQTRGVRTYQIPASAKTPATRADSWRRILFVQNRWFIAVFLIVAVVMLQVVDRTAVQPRTPEPFTPFWLYPGVLLAICLVPWWAFAEIVKSISSRQRGRTLETLWQGQPNLAVPMVVQFNEGGVTFSSAMFSHSYHWAALPLFIETENLFLLCPSFHGFFMVPKRAFESHDAAMAFIGVLTQHIGNGFVLKKEGGFPIQPLPVAQLAAEQTTVAS